MSLRHEIKAYLDGELDGEQALQVAHLLQSDESLRQEADDYRALSSTFRLVAEPRVEPYGLGDTLKALQQKERPSTAKPWWSRGWEFALAGASVLIIVAVVMPVFAKIKNAAKTSFATAATSAVGMKATMPAPMPPTTDNMAEMPKSDAAKLAVPAPVASARGAGASGGFSGNAKRAVGAPTITDTPPVTTETPTTVDSVYADPTASKSAAPKFTPLAKRHPFARSGAPTPSRPVPVATPPSRLVVQNGNLSLYVKDVQKAQNQIEATAKTCGGYVASSSLFDNAGVESQEATVQIRVPVARFQEALNLVRSLGEVYQEQVGGNDVTGQVADTEGRLKSLQAEANQLRELVHKAKNVDEVLQVRDRLSQVEEEIGGMDSQRNALRDQSAMSTLTVNLSHKPRPLTPQPITNEPPAQPTWLERTFADAASTFSSILAMVVGLLAQLLALSPIWVPVLALSYWGWKVSESKRGY